MQLFIKIFYLNFISIILQYLGSMILAFYNTNTEFYYISYRILFAIIRN